MNTRQTTRNSDDIEGDHSDDDELNEQQQIELEQTERSKRVTALKNGNLRRRYACEAKVHPDRGCTDVRGEPPDPTPGMGTRVSEVHHTQERPGAS